MANIKYLARILYNDVKPVNVTEETEFSYKTADGNGLRRKSTQYEVLFSTEIDAQIYQLTRLNNLRNKYRAMYQNAQKDLLDALLRFNLEQCEACNQFHAVGSGHECEHHQF